MASTSLLTRLRTLCFTRPAQQPTDPLFRSNRSIPGATNIPSEFFSEVDTLTNLEEPFKEVFNSEAMKQDRLLNWLMRSVHVSESDLNQAAEKGIVLIGDSCHHTRILGSDGASQAIDDVINLAEHIAGSGSQIQLQDFYRSRYAAWKQLVEDGEARLAEMHGKSRASL